MHATATLLSPADTHMLAAGLEDVLERIMRLGRPRSSSPMWAIASRSASFADPTHR
jgi:hypothetical protein